MDITNLINLLENKILSLSSIKAQSALLGNIEQYEQADLEILQTQNTLATIKKSIIE